MFSCEKFLKGKRIFLSRLQYDLLLHENRVYEALCCGGFGAFPCGESSQFSNKSSEALRHASAWSNFECYLFLVHFSSVSSSMFPTMKKKVLWFYSFRPKLYNITTTAARTFSPASCVLVLFMCNCIMKYYYVQLHRVCQTETDFHFE